MITDSRDTEDNIIEIDEQRTLKPDMTEISHH